MNNLLNNLVLRIDLCSDESDEAVGILANLALSTKNEAIKYPIVGEFHRVMSSAETGAADLLCDLAMARGGDVSALLDLEIYGNKPFTGETITQVVNTILREADDDFEELRLWGSIGAIWLMALIEQEPEQSWTNVIGKLDAGALGKIFAGIDYAEESPLAWLTPEQSKTLIQDCMETLLGSLLLDDGFPGEGLAAEFDTETFGKLFKRFAKVQGIQRAVELFFGDSVPEMTYRKVAFENLSHNWLKNTLLSLTNGRYYDYREAREAAEDSTDECEVRSLYIDIVETARIIRVAPPNIQQICLGFYSKKFQEEELKPLIH